MRLREQREARLTKGQNNEKQEGGAWAKKGSNGGTIRKMRSTGQ